MPVPLGVQTAVCALVSLCRLLLACGAQLPHHALCTGSSPLTLASLDARAFSDPNILESTGEDISHATPASNLAILLRCEWLPCKRFENS